MIPLATITPSANWVVEATTIALLRDVPGVVPIFSRTPMPDGMPDGYDLPAMLGAARLLATAKPVGMVWNGSKGGVIGLLHDRELCRRITADTGIAADTPALMLERRLAARGPTRLGVMTPYDDAYTTKLLAGFAAQGWQVAAEDHLGLTDNLGFGDVPADTILAQARRLAPRCDVLLAWCTNYPAGLIAAQIEAATGRPLWDATVLGVEALLGMRPQAEVEPPPAPAPTPDDYMQEQAEALAQHLRLNDGKSGYVDATAEGFRVFVRKKWPGKQMASWDGMPIEWHENVGTNKASGR